MFGLLELSKWHIGDIAHAYRGNLFRALLSAKSRVNQPQFVRLIPKSHDNTSLSVTPFRFNLFSSTDKSLNEIIEKKVPSPHLLLWVVVDVGGGGGGEISLSSQSPQKERGREKTAQGYAMAFFFVKTRALVAKTPSHNLSQYLKKGPFWTENRLAALQKKGGFLLLLAGTASHMNGREWVWVCVCVGLWDCLAGVVLAKSGWLLFPRYSHAMWGWWQKMKTDSWNANTVCLINELYACLQFHPGHGFDLKERLNLDMQQRSAHT